MRLALVWALVLVPWMAMAQSVSSSGPYRISGKLVNAITGEPMAEARMELTPTSGAQWVRAVLTGRDGKFTFQRLADGKYALYAERAGFPRQGFEEHPGGFLSAIAVGPNVESENIVFRMQPGAAITGVITDDYNEVVRDAAVFLAHRTIRDGTWGTYIVGERRTDDRGMYRFSPLMAGTYYLVVSARPWYSTSMRDFRAIDNQAQIPEGLREQTKALDVAYPLTYYDGATDEDNATAINLKPGDAVQADFRLQAVPAARIRIANVAGATSGPMPYINLSQPIFGNFDAPAPIVIQGGGSQRAISGVAPGRYLVKVTNRGGDRSTERSQVMDIRDDTILDPESITGEATASIVGLAGTQGVKLANTVIQFRHIATHRGRGSRIAEDGKFEVNQIPPGTYEVSISNQASVYLATMAASNAKVSGRTIEIPSGADVKMAVLLARGVGEIQGTALRDGKPVSGVMVVLVPDDPQQHVALFRRDQSDSDGTFSLKQVVPGAYTLVAIEHGWELEWTNPTVLKPFLAKGTRIQAEPNGRYNENVTVQ